MRWAGAVGVLLWEDWGASELVVGVGTEVLVRARASASSAWLISSSVRALPRAAHSSDHLSFASTLVLVKRLGTGAGLRCT